MSEPPHGERRYRVRRAGGELEYVDHDELWRVQQEEIGRIREERRRRGRRWILASAAAMVVLALLALLLWMVARRGPQEGPAVAGSAEGPTGGPTEPVELTPPPPEPGTETPEERASAAVRAWATAWSAQDVAAYLKGYSAAFRPVDGSSRSGWERLRRRRLEGPASIEVELEGLEIVLLDGGRARARFRQAYRSPVYSDVVLKTLELVDEEGVWRIVRETAEPAPDRSAP